MKNSLCKLCNIEEDYSQYFITCIFKEFWGKIKEVLKKCGIENYITLYHLVFGYKIFDKGYYDFNYVYSLFVREYLKGNFAINNFFLYVFPDV